MSGHLAGVPQRFLELLPQWLAIAASLFQDCMESFSAAARTDSRGLRILCQEHPVF